MLICLRAAFQDFCLVVFFSPLYAVDQDQENHFCTLLWKCVTFPNIEGLMSKSNTRKCLLQLVLYHIVVSSFSWGEGERRSTVPKIKLLIIKFPVEDDYF